MGEEKGTATLEAALTLPLLLCFGMALTWLLLTARAEAALREAVEEAVKTTAAHAYPIDLAARALDESEAVRRMNEELSRMMPSPLMNLLLERAAGGAEGSVGMDIDMPWSDSGLHHLWAKPFVMAFVDRKADGTPLLEPGRLRVTAAIVPTFASEETSYFGISAEYTMVLPVPFFPREILLTASAAERCWVGDKTRGFGL